MLLDAAMGTELENRGAWAHLPLWSAAALLDRPELVGEVHAEDVAAGAEALTANTFRTHRRTLAKKGMASLAAELTERAVRLAREAAEQAGRDVAVLGSLSPLEDCYRPDLVPSDEELAEEHEAQAAALARAGVDAILLETHNTLRELVAAARAAKATGLPVIASMVTDGHGVLLSGEPIEAAAEALAPLAPDAIGINCAAATKLRADLERLAAAAPGIPLAAYGNVTLFATDLSPEDYAELARGWIAVGARLVGGCCGTSARHTAALREMLDSSVRAGVRKIPPTS